MTTHKKAIKNISIGVFFILVITSGLYFLHIKQSIKGLSKNTEAISDFVQNDSLKQISLDFLLENAEDKYTAIQHTSLKIKDFDFVIKKTCSGISNNLLPFLKND